MKYYESVRNLRGKLLFGRHIKFSVVKKKAACHSAGSNIGIINSFKILIDFGWSFSDKAALPGGPF